MFIDFYFHDSSLLDQIKKNKKVYVSMFIDLYFYVLKLSVQIKTNNRLC